MERKTLSLSLLCLMIHIASVLSVSLNCNLTVPKCTNTPVEVCSNCCCNSTDNVEFYNPRGFNPPCTASEAIYRVKFVGTWTGQCHPNYYFRSAHWSPLTGVSHDPSYEVWNACMYSVSRGVALVSQIGSTGTIEGEYRAAGSKVKDTFRGSVIGGAGTMMDTVGVNASHSYVTALTMLAPSADRMMGVSRLQLCQRTCWKDRVVVCGELFSTATRSMVLGRPNTIQSNNCSFGYFEFELVSCDGGTCGPCPTTSPPPSLYRDECPPVQGDPQADSCLCQPKLPKCTKTPIEACSTCCCNSTGTVSMNPPTPTVTIATLMPPTFTIATPMPPTFPSTVRRDAALGVVFSLVGIAIIVAVVMVVVVVLYKFTSVCDPPKERLRRKVHLKEEESPMRSDSHSS